MGKFIDITGQRFGSVVVTEKAGRDRTGKTMWFCDCDCGRSFATTGLNLKSGNTTTCGCSKAKPSFEDLAGQTFGRLTAISATTGGGIARWLCRCSCGAEATVTSGKLKSGHTRSCGCLMAEIASANAKKNLGCAKENHPRWGTGNGPYNPGRPYGVTIWARAVKSRDGYQCVNCGSTKRPEAHHILSYVACEERQLDLANGVTLCRKCHTAFHAAAGRAKFTRADFFTFINMPGPGDFSIWGPMPDGLMGEIIHLVCGDSLADLRKAAFYVQREIARRGG